MNKSTIDAMLKMKLIKEWNGTYVLSALGQANYSDEGIDPRSWVGKREKGNMSFSELCEECGRVFGVEPERVYEGLSFTPHPKTRSPS